MPCIINFSYMLNKRLVSIAFYIPFLLFFSCSDSVKKYTHVDALPGIFPDYTSIVLPPNIAPLNFNIEEAGSEYYVEISSVSGDKIKVRQNSSKIIIPADKWHTLLAENKGELLKIDVFVKNDKWLRFNSITDTIALEEIDSNLAYRLLPIVYTDGDKMGIYQRNLEEFDQSVIFENTSTPERPCLNCHSVSANNPGKMSLHIRKSYSGTVIYDKGKYTKYNTKTEYTMAPAAYTAWHPNGELIAFSLNRIFVNFTVNEDKLVEVCDQSSDLVLYNEKTNQISTSPKISGERRETLPNWSPDGKSLYFISAPKANDDMSNWMGAKYDLMRISFNPDNHSWGDLETLISSKETGLSITFPSASPDGRYILFCMIDHSYFSIFDKNSDLYLFDLQTKKYRKADVLNSQFTDSFHTWSKNGRWVVFSSKRLDELCTRPYFAYFDKDGNFHKPFVLPQEDPLFYNSFKWHYNLPVLVDGKIEIDTTELYNAITGKSVDVSFDKNISIDTSSTVTKHRSNYY